MEAAVHYGAGRDDRCHLNGLAVLDGRPGFVTALGETDTRRLAARQGGRGCVMRSRVACRSFVASRCHTHRVCDGQLWLLESGRRAPCQNGPNGGLDSSRSGVHVGLSPGTGIRRSVRLRRSVQTLSVLDPANVVRRPPHLRADDSAKLWRISRSTSVSGREVRLEFHSGIDEIFDMRLRTRVIL